MNSLGKIEAYEKKKVVLWLGVGVGGIITFVLLFCKRREHFIMCSYFLLCYRRDKGPFVAHLHPMTWHYLSQVHGILLPLTLIQGLWTNILEETVFSTPTLSHFRKLTMLPYRSRIPINIQFFFFLTKLSFTCKTFFDITFQNFI